MTNIDNYAERQLTRKEAIAIDNSGIWKYWSVKKVIGVQLFQKRVCMENDYFWECLDKFFQRHITNFEVAANGKALREEYLNKYPMLNIEDILEELANKNMIRQLLNT